MITVVTRWELLQMPPDLEWRMWRQLKGAFNISRFCFAPIIPEMNNRTFEQFETIGEALKTCQGTKIFLEPTGKNKLTELPNIDNPVFILGNTERGNKDLVSELDMEVRIDTPKQVDFYGINAAAIALTYWCGQ